jgi:hypothetical protein
MKKLPLVFAILLSLPVAALAAGEEADPSRTAGEEADPARTAGEEADPARTAGEEADPARGGIHHTTDGSEQFVVDESAPDLASGAIRIAVTDFQVDGVDERVARVVNASLLAELRKLSRVSVIGMDEIRAMLDLEAQKQAVGCDEDDSCLAEIAGALGADVLVIGTLAKVGDQHVFGMRRVDQRTASVAGGVNKSMAAKDGEEFLAALGPAVAELFPERALRKGVERGVSTEAVRRLNPPPLQPAWFWSATGTAVLAAGVGALFGTAGALVWTDYRRLVAESKEEPVEGAELVLRQTLSQGAYGTAIVAGSVALIAGASAGVLVLFTDWEGLGAEEE